MRLISVVMGAPNDQSRTEDSIRLLTYGFRFFETHKLYGAGTSITKAHAWKGAQKQIDLGVAEDLYATYPVNQAKNVQAEVKLDDSIVAPIVKGQAYGTLNILANNQIIASKPLVALENDPKGGMWGNLADSVSYRFHRIFSKNTEKANNG
jgi:D-alanyl-D-alanine carboxypeptidase (penicillin-binding protein 5/6)